LGDQDKEGEMGAACSMHGNKVMQNVRKPEGKRPLGRARVDVSISE
jgi:hypothetical protein